MLEWGLNTAPIGSEAPLIKHLRSIKKQTGKTPPKLQEYEEKQAPSHFKYLLDLFYDFYNGQQFSYTELQSWLNLTCITLEPWEVEIIRQLCLEKDTFDSKRQLAYIKRQQSKQGRK